MAIAFTVAKATPNRLVYKFVGDGASAASTVSKSNAQLLADCVEGPLKDLIAASYADSAAVQAVFGGGDVEVATNTQIGTSGFIAIVGPIFTESANKPVLGFDAVVPANGDACFVVIEHKHSVVQ
jgi:hypothetical protein